jgi:hypothetical protein
MPKKKILGVSCEDIEFIFKAPLYRLSVPRILYQNCVINNCKETKIEVYHIKKLIPRLIDNVVGHSVITKSGWAKKQQVASLTLTRKQIPLCAKHYNA